MTTDRRTSFGFLDGETGESFAEAVEAERNRFDADVAERSHDIVAALEESTD